jgi:hypothetical protein
VAPVALDLDGDGAITFLGADEGVTYDYDSDGVREATAWVGAHDGILVRDADGNGTASNAGEFVFGVNGQSDLEALRAQYGDALDSEDADFANFAVWTDANSNGVAEDGEVVSLAAAGITSLSLVSDGIAYSAASGDVTVAGSSSYTTAAGSTGLIADAAFWTGSRTVEEQARTSAANSNAVVIGAVAAAGLMSATPAAANAPAFDLPAVMAGDILEAAAGAGLSPVKADIRPAVQRELPEPSKAEAQADGDHGAPAQASYPSAGDGIAPAAEALPQLSGLLQGTDMPAQAQIDSIAPVADAVAMPDAAMLQALDALEGEAKHSGEVSRVIAEAIDGGGAGPDLTSVIDALTNQGGGGGAPEGLASVPEALVSAWDTAAFAGFHYANQAFTMDAMQLHHDAVQPAA